MDLAVFSSSPDLWLRRLRALASAGASVHSFLVSQIRGGARRFSPLVQVVMGSSQSL